VKPYFHFVILNDFIAPGKWAVDYFEQVAKDMQWGAVGTPQIVGALTNFVRFQTKNGYAMGNELFVPMRKIGM
jgi:hypothetical protein